MEIKKYNDYIKETQPQDNVFRKFIFILLPDDVILQVEIISYRSNDT